MHVAAPAELRRDNWREDYYRRLEQSALAPLWERLGDLVPAQPVARALPYMWRFSELKVCALQAAKLISAEDAERRVLVLENPGMPGESQITDTIYAGVQTILPGEIARSHRHSQSALRFVLDGSGAYTVVDGERATMRPGDFIITPAWTWHDHGSDSDEPVLWMDGLDVPLVTFLKAGFREEDESIAQEQLRPDEGVTRFGSGLLPLDMTRATHTSPILNYPYDRTREVLDAMRRHSDPDVHSGHALRYVNPTDGGWAIPTLATGMRLLPKGFSSRPYRSTDGTVFVVVEGSVEFAFGDERRHAGPKDIVIAPGWRRYTVTAAEESVLFSFSDRPTHEKLGLWREERG